MKCNDFKPSIVITTERVKLPMHKHTNTENNNNRRYTRFIYLKHLSFMNEKQRNLLFRRNVWNVYRQRVNNWISIEKIKAMCNRLSMSPFLCKKCWCLETARMFSCFSTLAFYLIYTNMYVQRIHFISMTRVKIGKNKSP